MKVQPYRLKLAKAGILHVAESRASHALEAHAIASAELRDEPFESFIAIFLNVRHDVLGLARLATSSNLGGASIAPNAVFRAGFACNAAAAIVAHNHPSGDPRPSKEDGVITAALVSMGDILGFPIVDHVIVAGDAYFSFQESGLLK